MTTFIDAYSAYVLPDTKRGLVCRIAAAGSFATVAFGWFGQSLLGWAGIAWTALLGHLPFAIVCAASKTALASRRSEVM